MLRTARDRQPHTGQAVEFVSFTAPPFDGALGKGYGEMLCLEHALQNSRLLSESSHS